MGGKELGDFQTTGGACRAGRQRKVYLNFCTGHLVNKSLVPVYSV